MGLFDRFKKNRGKAKIPDIKITYEIDGKAVSSEELEELWKEEKIIREENKKYSKSIRIWADNNTKGQNFEEQGKIDKAIKCYEKNVKLNADTPFTYNRLASLYHMKYEFEKERDTLKLFINRCIDNPRANKNNIIDYRERLENVEQFLDTGKWKFDCLPSDAKTTYYDIKEAKTLLKSEEKEKGIKILEKIMLNGTFNNTVYNTLFQTYKKDKQFDDAIRVCEKAIEVLGFFSNDRKERWTINLDKVTKQKEKKGK